MRGRNDRKRSSSLSQGQCAFADLFGTKAKLVVKPVVTADAK
jgi:hypothetical protein